MALPKPEPRPERRSWFELVRTDAGWHARLVGLNGEIVMASESHPGRRVAEAVLALCRGAVPRTEYVDERTPKTPGSAASPVVPAAAEPGPTQDAER